MVHSSLLDGGAGGVGDPEAALVDAITAARAERRRRRQVKSLRHGSGVELRCMPCKRLLQGERSEVIDCPNNVRSKVLGGGGGCME